MARPAVTWASSLIDKTNSTTSLIDVHFPRNVMRLPTYTHTQTSIAQIDCWRNDKSLAASFLNQIASSQFIKPNQPPKIASFIHSSVGRLAYLISHISFVCHLHKHRAPLIAKLSMSNAKTFDDLSARELLLAFFVDSSAAVEDEKMWNAASS